MRLGRPAHVGSPGKDRPQLLGWDHMDLVPDPDHLPFLFMHQAVVVVAEENQVVQVGRPTSRPELDVVRSRPAHRPVAAGPAATSIALLQRPPGRRRDGAGGPADVDPGAHLGGNVSPRLSSAPAQAAQRTSGPRVKIVLNCSGGMT